MSSEARLFCGITLLTVPTIVYGGLTVLNVVSSGHFGMTAPKLTDVQTTYFRAGHAHAGVLVIFSLVLQLLLDGAKLPTEWLWALRIAAPLAAICVSGGFFGVAYFASFRLLLYTGAALVTFVTVGTGIGLLR
jgi:hypothetical protein